MKNTKNVSRSNNIRIAQVSKRIFSSKLSFIFNAFFFVLWHKIFIALIEGCFEWLTKLHCASLPDWDS